MALNINGRMKVKTLRADFIDEFGLTLRIYDGRSFADDDATLASIRKGDSKGGEFAPKRNTKVGNLEDKILEMFGIKTQVAGSDDSYLCDNDLTLAGALEEDEKKIQKRANRRDNSDEGTREKEPSQSQMSLAEVIEEVKKRYADSENYQEMIDDLKNKEALVHWADEFMTEEFGKNYVLAKEVLKLALEETEESSSYDLNGIANTIADKNGINDSEWAKKVFKLAIEKAEDASDLNIIAGDIADKNGINDLEWAKKVFKLAIEKAEDTSDLRVTACGIADKNGINDSEWAKKVFNLAIDKAEDASDLNIIAEDIAKLLNDKQILREVYLKALEKTNLADQLYMKFYIACGIYLELDKEWGFELGNSVIDDSEIDNGDLIEVVRSIRRGCDIFENRLENIYQKMFENAEESGVMAELTELVKSYLYDDKDKVKKYCELIIGGCNDVYCYLEIANCLANDVEDKEWARKIYEDALYDCENGEDRERVIEDIEYYLDEDWAAELREDG